jgi:hypothetical protein
VIVTSPVKVIIDNTSGSLITHALIHIAISKKENSLICHKDNHAKKLFFLVCHINQSIMSLINGFIINTNPLNIITFI